MPSPRLLLALVGLSVTPPLRLAGGMLNSTDAPARGWPSVPMARKRTVVTSPMRGCAGTVSTNSSDAGWRPPHPSAARRRPQVAALAARGGERIVRDSLGVGEITRPARL